MIDTISSLFSGVEVEKRQQIKALMADWKSEIARKYKNEPDPDFWEGCDPLSYFIEDGFFPGYYNQKIKVLFIGRETRYMYEEGDWVQCTIKYYKNNNDHNQKAFTRHLLYIIQGIKASGKLKFENRKKANDYAKEMATTNDYGFAYMNISKYSNVGDDGDKANFEFINKFLEDSNLENRNYFQKELEILDPDVIITGNFWEVPINEKYLDLCFGKIEWKKVSDDVDGKVNMSNIILNGKSIKLLNTYAFADYSLKDKDYFYDPIMEIIFNEKST